MSFFSFWIELTLNVYISGRFRINFRLCWDSFRLIRFFRSKSWIIFEWKNYSLFINECIWIPFCTSKGKKYKICNCKIFLDNSIKIFPTPPIWFCVGVGFKYFGFGLKCIQFGIDFKQKFRIRFQGRVFWFRIKSTSMD